MSDDMGDQIAQGLMSWRYTCAEVSKAWVFEGDCGEVLAHL